MLQDYRLNNIPIHLPLLRERIDCILPLISHYIDYFSKKYDIKGTIALKSSTADALEAYAFPGNVRELINICERLVVLNESKAIENKDLPKKLLAQQKTIFFLKICGTRNYPSMKWWEHLKKRFKKISWINIPPSQKLQKYSS